VTVTTDNDKIDNKQIRNDRAQRSECVRSEGKARKICLALLRQVRAFFFFMYSEGMKEGLCEQRVKGREEIGGG